MEQQIAGDEDEQSGREVARCHQKGDDDGRQEQNIEGDRLVEAVAAAGYVASGENHQHHFGYLGRLESGQIGQVKPTTLVVEGYHQHKQHDRD